MARVRRLKRGPGLRQLVNRVGQVQGEAILDLLDDAPGKTHSHANVEDNGEPGVREATAATA